MDNRPEEGFSAVGYWKDFNSISDRINPVRWGTDGHRPPGPVNHLQALVKDIQTSTTFVDPNNGSTVVMTNHAAALLANMYPLYSPRNYVYFNGWLNLLGKFEDTPTYKNLCVEAFNKQITQVPSKTSVINFAIELIELKPIFKSLAKIPKYLREGAFTRKTSLRSLKRSTPVNVARKGAKGFLAAEFQWLPFVSDIATFMGTMEAVAKRLDYLIKTRGKETTVRFVKEDCYQRPLGELYVQDDGSNAKQFIALDQYQCDFVSTWKLFQELEGLDAAWADLRATFAHLGVNNPAKIIWNAIPFSFLIDWVAPVSSWLERAAVQPFYGVWNVYDATSSIHEKYVISQNFHAKAGGSHGPEFKVHCDNYRRLTYLPITAGAIDFSQLSDTQQKLALALVVASH